MGIEILRPSATGFDFSGVAERDVVIVPAFGVTLQDFRTLRERGVVVVDTTCGSVLNVWKRVDTYARDGFTSLIHGKHYHEETRATASQVTKYPGGAYLVVRDMGEAALVCDYIEGRGDRARFMERLGAAAASPDFDPDRHLERIGVANQTTMLARESLAIGEVVGQSMERSRGPEYKAANFRTFDTICSATQDRQDAVEALLVDPPDLMVVIGGYNSSNTISLAALCAVKVPTYHVEDADCIEVESAAVRYRPIGGGPEQSKSPLLPPGPVRVGVTAGASTPNNKIGEAIARIFATRGIALSALD